MAEAGFRYFKYWGRALCLAAGVFVGFHLRRAAFYSPMKEEFEDIVTDHTIQTARLKSLDKRPAS